MREKYTTILIGNGLGMAIDPAYFRIDRGLSNAWNNLILRDQERIKSLITDKNDLNNEEQLNRHYEAIQACMMLSKIEKHSDLSWLHPEARSFPDNFRNFIVDTSLHFFEYQLDYNPLYDKFISNLKSYILNNKTNLATLNYDKLIYDQFSTDIEIMYYDKGRLIDGFLVKSTGFTPSILTDAADDIGYYLHLHGSPLFYTDNEKELINKSRFENYHEDIENDQLHQEHLILCATDLKKSQISQSFILKSYWSFFKKGLLESDKILLFGYSGNDVHLNEEISKVQYGKKITIVEYADETTNKESRIFFWKNKLNLHNSTLQDVNLILLGSVLEYNFT